MQIIINGEAQQLTEEHLTITRLLQTKKVESPDMVSVQINGRIIEREKYVNTEIAENDEINFLYFMGGGSR